MKSAVVNGRPRYIKNEDVDDATNERKEMEPSLHSVMKV